jgi:hypothetical protein
MSLRKIPPIHPGEIPQEEFLDPFGISQYRLAKDTSVSPRRINELCEEPGRSPPIPPYGYRDIWDFGAVLVESASAVQPGA